MTDKYVFFWSGVFSNWLPCKFTVDGTEYNCSEQYLMAAKARMFGDEVALNEIMKSDDPSYQKAVGRQVHGFDKKKWNDAARDVMYTACLAKFKQNPKLLKKLLDTGSRTIVEASPEDVIWGIGLYWKSELCDDPKNWRGTNWLGETLTRVRNDIKNSSG